MPRDAMSRGRLWISERDSEADLTDALFGLLEIAGIRDRLHEAGLLRAGRGVDALRGQRQRRVLRVEQVEHFRDRFDPGRSTRSGRPC